MTTNDSGWYAEPDVALAQRLGQILARERRRLGLTQTEFAHAFGATQSVVSAWERGRHTREDKPSDAAAHLRYIQGFERVFELERGDILDWLGVTKRGPVKCDVETAILDDDRLTADQQENFLGLYRAIVGKT